MAQFIAQHNENPLVRLWLEHQSRCNVQTQLNPVRIGHVHFVFLSIRAIGVKCDGIGQVLRGKFRVFVEVAVVKFSLSAKPV